MRKSKGLLRGVCLLLSTGYILYFFSEAMFWSQLRPDEGLLDRPLSWIFYAYLGYLMLAILRYFRIRDITGLLLAGAAYGWINEGVFAMTLFGDPSMPFPFTISWTGLAWHAPISVVLGWHALGTALRREALGPTVWLSLGFGVFWGFWAYGWRFETPPVTASPAAFLSQVMAATVLLAAAYVAVAAGQPDHFRPSRVGVVLASLVLLGFLGVVTVPHVPIALLVLPPLGGLLLLLLNRHRRAHPDTGMDILAQHAAMPRRANLGMLALMPLVATLVYTVLGASEWPLNTLPLFGTLATGLGATLFVLAAVRTLRRSTAQ